MRPKPWPRWSSCAGCRRRSRSTASSKFAAIVSYSHALLDNHGALVRPELLTQLGVEVGEQILIGSTSFTIRGVMLTEPGNQMGAFSLGSRILVDYDDLRRSGLLVFGSRADYEILVKLEEAGIRPLGRAATGRSQRHVRAGEVLSQ